MREPQEPAVRQLDWNGTQWSIVPSPNVPPATGRSDELDGVVVSGPTTLWTVGIFVKLSRTNGGLRTLTQHTAQG